MTYILPTQATPSKAPRTILLQNLSSQLHLLTQLFTHLSSSHPSPSQPGTSTALVHQIYTSLQERTDQLASLVEEVEAHQIAYRALERRKAEVSALERVVRGLVRDLEKGRKELEKVVFEGRQVQRSVEKSTAREAFRFLPPSMYRLGSMGG